MYERSFQRWLCVFGTLLHSLTSSFSTLLLCSLAASYMLFPSANVFIIIFFNSFCKATESTRGFWFQPLQFFVHFFFPLRRKKRGEKIHFVFIEKKHHAQTARENKVSLKSVLLFINTHASCEPKFRSETSEELDYRRETRNCYFPCDRSTLISFSPKALLDQVW